MTSYNVAIMNKKETFKISRACQEREMPGGTHEKC
jgi:hypothetical protein